ncbi:MAG TPA: hypothetical protein DCL91_02975 [Prevotella stercorea]|nr:hypothetical protein [Leyella stercorea]
MISVLITASIEVQIIISSIASSIVRLYLHTAYTVFCGISDIELAALAFLTIRNEVLTYRISSARSVLKPLFSTIVIDVISACLTANFIKSKLCIVRSAGCAIQIAINITIISITHREYVFGLSFVG